MSCCGRIERVKRVIPAFEWPAFAPEVDAILRLKRERNAVVLAHNYQTPEIFHGVADKNQGLDLQELGFAPGVGEYLADLGMTHAAIDTFHQPGKVFGLGDPAGGAAFGKPRRSTPT